MKNHDNSPSPPRNYKGQANGGVHLSDQQALNLANMKMRTTNQGNPQLGQQAYMQSLNTTLDQDGFIAIH